MSGTATKAKARSHNEEVLLSATADRTTKEPILLSLPPKGKSTGLWASGKKRVRVKQDQSCEVMVGTKHFPLWSLMRKDQSCWRKHEKESD